MDRDGDLDVFGAAAYSGSEWYENTDGLGTFVFRQNLGVLSSPWASPIDVDRDGDPDVLGVRQITDQVSWFENTDAQGTFGTGQSIGTTDQALRIFGADLDLDGDGDAVVIGAGTNAPFSFSWFENTDGLGGYGPERRISSTEVGSIFLAEDIDGDGDPDLLGISNSENTTFWIEQRNVANPLLADSDGDGLLDGAEVHTHCTDPLNPDSDGDGLSDGAEVSTHSTDPREADTDGDGMPDGFELTHGFDALDPDENTNGRLDGAEDPDSDGVGSGAEAAFGTNPTVADTDGDGLDDGQEVGTGNFILKQVLSPTSAGVTASIFTIDIDSDDDLDVLHATSYFGGKLKSYENMDGLGTFGPEKIVAASFYSRVLASGADLDGDRDVDFISSSVVDLTWLENGDSAGSFGGERLISSSRSSAVVAADLDGDCDSDLLSFSVSTNRVSWFENADGQGGFGPEQTLQTSVGASSGVAADLDGDGDLDVLSRAGPRRPRRVVREHGRSGKFWIRSVDFGDYR